MGKMIYFHGIHFFFFFPTCSHLFNTFEEWKRYQCSINKILYYLTCYLPSVGMIALDLDLFIICALNHF